ncbi:MAG TPA: Crp/Fnr family transcriptional regulator [Prolixibacteraceae bacterium]|jgi:CRP-like cAMP-binding protein
MIPHIHFPIDKFTSKNDSILKGLPQSVIDSIESMMIDKTFKKGQSIFTEGSFPAGIFYIKAGMVKKFKTDHNGKEHILYLCSTGELLGYSAILCNETYPDSAIALEPSKLGFIPNEAFLRILSQSAELMMGILSSLSHEFGVLVNSVRVFAHMSVKERLALTLLILAEKFKKEEETIGIEIKLSREDLANMVGTAVETLVRLLAELKKDGIISTDGRTIKLLKPMELIIISKFY